MGLTISEAMAMAMGMTMGMAMAMAMKWAICIQGYIGNGFLVNLIRNELYPSKAIFWNMFYWIS